jgi:hypothetical protein
MGSAAIKRTVIPAARRLWWVVPVLIAAVVLAEIVWVLWRRPPMG